MPAVFAKLHFRSRHTYLCVKLIKIIWVSGAGRPVNNLLASSGWPSHLRQQDLAVPHVFPAARLFARLLRQASAGPAVCPRRPMSARCLTAWSNSVQEGLQLWTWPEQVRHQTRGWRRGEYRDESDLRCSTRFREAEGSGLQVSRSCRSLLIPLDLLLCRYRSIRLASFERILSALRAAGVRRALRRRIQSVQRYSA